MEAFKSLRASMEAQNKKNKICERIKYWINTKIIINVFEVKFRHWGHRCIHILTSQCHTIQESCVEEVRAKKP